jgi:hypothetical protein
MLLVDKSGSMDQPVDPTIPACHVGSINGPLCGDPQKSNPVTDPVPDALERAHQGARRLHHRLPAHRRYGLSLFPEPETSGGCGPTTKQTSALPTTASDDDPTLQQAPTPPRARWTRS